MNINTTENKLNQFAWNANKTRGGKVDFIRIHTSREFDGRVAMTIAISVQAVQELKLKPHERYILGIDYKNQRIAIRQTNLGGVLLRGTNRGSKTEAWRLMYTMNFETLPIPQEIGLNDIETIDEKTVAMPFKFMPPTIFKTTLGAN